MFRPYVGITSMLISVLFCLQPSPIGAGEALKARFPRANSLLASVVGVSSQRRRNTCEMIGAHDSSESRGMTKIQAIVREEMLDAIVERLLLIGVRGLTFGHVRGTGRTAAHREVFRGSAYQVAYATKLLVEWYGPDDEADAVMRAIQQRATTGQGGDGRIFVSYVEEAVRIRTGERGLDAV